MTKPNKQFGEGTSGVKKAPKAQSTRRIFVRSIPIDIPIAEVMMTSYSEEVTTPKTAKVKFVKSSTSSTPVMVPRTLQFKEATPPPVPMKSRKILPSGAQSQSDLNSNRAESQTYSGPITRSRAKALTYAEVTLQSSITTFGQGKEQLEEQDDVTSPVFYDLKTLFQEEESPVVLS